MEFEFLKTGLIAPKPVGRSKKDKLPIESIWNRYLRLSQETISKSIKDWDNYINKPESRSDNYYSAKNCDTSMLVAFMLISMLVACVLISMLVVCLSTVAACVSLSVAFLVVLDC